MSFRKSIYIVIAAFLLNACSSKIEGEAFVVTKGGESNKLGLVEVQAYKMSDIEGFKKKLLSEYSAFIDKTAEDYKFVGLKEIYDERKQLISELKDANKKYENCHTGWLGKECNVKLPKEVDADFERRKKKIAVGTLAIIGDKAVKLDKNFDLIYLAERVAENTKSLDAIKTKTDADGKFAMTLPSGEYLIVATGGRQSLGEVYFWLLHTNKGGAIRLANDSMFDQGCDKCLFTKDDMGNLIEKKKSLNTFLNGNGEMMIYSASIKETGIYDNFWRYMCGGAYTSNPVPVFDWAKCVR